MSDDIDVTRMETFLEKNLERCEGKICVEQLSFPVSSWGITMFRKFLKVKVQKGILKSEKDEIGRIWYSKV